MVVMDAFSISSFDLNGMSPIDQILPFSHGGAYVRI
jgi:hypothetical protein